MMTQSRGSPTISKRAAAASREPKLAANWIMGEISRRLNAAGIDDDTRFRPSSLRR